MTNLWYNFDTMQHDSGPTDNGYGPYLPIGPARNLYSALIECGNPPLRAFAYALEAAAGVPHEVTVRLP